MLQLCGGRRVQVDGSVNDRPVSNNITVDSATDVTWRREQASWGRGHAIKGFPQECRACWFGEPDSNKRPCSALAAFPVVEKSSSEKRSRTPVRKPKRFASTVTVTRLTSVLVLKNASQMHVCVFSRLIVIRSPLLQWGKRG